MTQAEFNVRWIQAIRERRAQRREWWQAYFTVVTPIVIILGLILFLLSSGCRTTPTKRDGPPEFRTARATIAPTIATQK